jgi:23S rRNA (pseudouridine1915-N3)-methyltransferase
VHLRVLAVGDRQPSWVDDAVKSYAGRLPPAWRFTVDTLPPAKRSKSDRSMRAREEEGAAILRQVDDEFVVLLDERGRPLSSLELAERVEHWQHDGRNLCFVIGGPDGVAGTVRDRADFSWSLSRLTLPHGLARILCVEQLYRAWSLTAGHPYHRA